MNVAIPSRASVVALLLCGNTTHIKTIHQISHGYTTPNQATPHRSLPKHHTPNQLRHKEQNKEGPKHLPRCVDQWVVGANVGLALDDVHARTIQPALVEGLRERERVDDGAACSVDEDSGGLHLPEPAGGEDVEDVRLARKRRERDTLDLFDAEFCREGGISAGVGVGGGGGGLTGVEGALEAEGDEAGEGGLGDVAEADEAYSAHGRGGAH